MFTEPTTQSYIDSAPRDELTGLWKRESLLGFLFPETDRVQRMRTSLAFLLLDVDRFGNLNAEFGREAGDKVLKELANRLRRFMRSYDLIGRICDDEFLIALPGCTSAQALQLADRIRTVLLLPTFSTGHEMVSVTVCIGLAQSRGRSPLIVLREAEHALAEAKCSGRNSRREYVGPQPERSPA